MFMRAFSAFTNMKTKYRSRLSSLTDGFVSH